MSLTEILEQLPKLTEDEKRQLGGAGVLEAEMSEARFFDECSAMRIPRRSSGRFCEQGRGVKLIRKRP